MTSTEKISKLVNLWYEVIGGLHHKDRDCHFYIQKHWQYDGGFTYDLVHSGYLLAQKDDSFSTLKDAEDALIELLKGGIHLFVYDMESSLTQARRMAIDATLNSI